MYKNGFLKVAAVTPKIVAGDILNNQNEIINILNKSKAALVLFPELTITGYSIADLFFQDKIINDSLKALKYILDNNKHEGLAFIGMPLTINNILFNVGVVIQKNKILGVIPKYYLPNNGEYQEKRWFESGFKANFIEVEILNQKVPFGKILFKELNKDITVGVEICQDMWQINPPSNDLAMAGANVILNLSASSELINKNEIRRNIVKEHSRRQVGAYLYTTTGIYESSSEHLYSSQKLIASLGEVLSEGSSIEYDESIIEADINITHINFKRRQDSNYRSNGFNNKDIYQVVNFEIKESDNFKFGNKINLYPYVLNDNKLNHIYEILTASLVKKILSLPKTNRKIILGLSGGLDSTHALLIAYNAFKKLELPLSDLIVVAMPAKVSSKSSMEDAISLTKGLGLELKTINIENMVEEHLKDIKHHELDVTYENAQARIRTLVLMNLANKYRGFVLGTGDLSEIALGFMTYNGDQMSMYAINAGLPKTTIKALINYYANNLCLNIKDVLLKIVNKKISPELLEDQTTESIIGSYEINDFIMHYHLECGLELEQLIWLVETSFEISNIEASNYVNRFINRFYNQAFKRTVMPEGPKVFEISLSPRYTFKLPSDLVRKWLKWIKIKKL